MLLNPKEQIKRKPGTVTLVSMSRKAKIPPCDIYIDVASFMVDDFDYRMNGTETYIKNTLYALHTYFFLNLRDMIISIPLESGLLVVLACEKGERRSVASVEILAGELYIHGNLPIVKRHMGLEKWLTF